ncbi:MAG: Zn-dependent hydrolase [Candidatus Rokubacteria bacterium GWC2_70_24]|nr:MAG: Zn-dependent hydrolase [Candidatus Rokubacteria bacterium GWA2_70_23]OGK89440.1 MAG: Zn-dependent hydrolase [Candidatus Rokubacteria bacterium GWF2_70_14]OGK91882.1 MAG: Zn-dependent hydrolase [Candidatus Rokubacteria bacterium GWC2_70_24]
MLKIDAARLYRAIEALGRIGAYVDEPTGLTGVNRLALTDADGEGRRQVLAWMRELGLDVTVDRIGNVYARRAGREDTLPPVVIGSHIDSVPTAGRFDGCLGVLGGLEIVRTLHESNIRTRRPIVVAFFTDEEGSRFGTDMLGSAVATGRLPLESAYALRDRQGLAVRDELERIGFLGPAPVETIQRMPPHAYLECHIEQGPILRARERDIGVVTGVQAISWQALTITGKSAHAGTTPMHLRADAGVAAAKVNLRLREMIASGRYGEPMRATMGAIVPHPGMVNIVPGRALATVDLRNPSEEDMRRAEADLISYYTQVEREEKVRIEWRRTARTEPVPFDPKIQDRIAAAADALGLGHERIISGAGHDAQELARLCPTAMVFVPGEHDGISHNPREYSTPEQCASGVNVMLQIALDLAEE